MHFSLNGLEKSYDVIMYLNIMENYWVEVIMGISGSYSISIWVYLGGRIYRFLALILSLGSTFIRRRLTWYDFCYACRCFHFQGNIYSNALEVTEIHFRPKNTNLELRPSVKLM